MSERGQRLHAVLDGYAKLLLDKALVLQKHQAWCVQQTADAVRIYRGQHRGQHRGVTDGGEDAALA